MNITEKTIADKIYLVRGEKVMLDNDLAEIYGVTTKRLKEQVKRNLYRFPADFMFQLTTNEWENLRSHSATSSWGGSRYLPMAFTEQGVAMLSSVLGSKTAIEVNIQIIRIFTKMRRILAEHKEIISKLDKIEHELMKHGNQLKKHDNEIQLVFETLKQLLIKPENPRKPIGFRKK